MQALEEFAGAHEALPFESFAHKPTLATAEAVSDLDQVYWQMLFSNRNYGWARLLYQRNVARWKYWAPQTQETTRRLQLAESAIAACDRHIIE